MENVNVFEVMSKKMNDMDSFMLETNRAFANITETLKVVVQENAENRVNIRQLQDNLSTTNGTAVKALEKITLRDENGFGEDWLGQADLGLMFEPAITSHNIGDILRLIGMAKKTKSRTTPYANVIKSGHVRRGYANNFTSWYWYAPKVKEDFIDILKDKDLYTKFLTITEDNEMKEFIKSIR